MVSASYANNDGRRDWGIEDAAMNFLNFENSNPDQHIVGHLRQRPREALSAQSLDAEEAPECAC